MSGSNELELSKTDKTECIIKYGKIIMITFITANIISFIIYSNVADHYLTKSKRKDIFTFCGNIESLVLLFIGIYLFVNVFTTLSFAQEIEHPTDKVNFTANIGYNLFNRSLFPLLVKD